MNDTPSARTPAIIGFLVVGAVILGASFFVSTLNRDGYDAIPPISIIGPASGDTVSNPVTITFRTPGALAYDDAMGWMAGELHLHAMVSGTEIMPAAADIAPGDSLFTWRLPAVEPGEHRIYLTWAGRHHGNLRGQADTVAVFVAQ